MDELTWPYIVIILICNQSAPTTTRVPIVLLHIPSLPSAHASNSMVSPVPRPMVFHYTPIGFTPPVGTPPRLHALQGTVTSPLGATELKTRGKGSQKRKRIAEKAAVKKRRRTVSHIEILSLISNWGDKYTMYVKSLRCTWEGPQPCWTRNTFCRILRRSYSFLYR